MNDLGTLPKSWTISTMEEETEFITDYVANGSFKSLSDNVSYKDLADFAYLIRLTDFNNNFEGKFVYVDEHSYNFLKKSKLFGGEIIIANVGAYAGATFLAPKLDRPMTLGPNAIMMNFKNGNAFYFYWLKSPIGKFVLDGIISGSAQPKFNKTSFRKLKIPVPPPREQKAIAQVLSSLDDKIDLLHRQNKTLEELAQTLFRQWFLEEAKDEWEVGTLEDIMDFNPTHSLKKGEMYPFLEMGNVQTFKSSVAGWYKRAFTSGTKFKNGDTLLARITPSLENGKTAYVDFLQDNEIGWGSTEFIVMRMKEDYHPFISYLFARNDDFREFAIGNMTGSTGRQRAQAKDIKEYEISIPPLKIIEKLNKAIEPIPIKIKANAEQIKTLDNTRDTLLPKLMSGEVRIML